MRNAYSLSEFCALISDTLENNFTHSYWVRAEIVNLNTRGGHCYMELAEKAGQNGLFSAKVRATCWQNIYAMLSSYFSTETGETLRVGLQVLVEVEVNFHAVYGLSLNIIGIDPAYTKGSLQKQKEETLLRLKKEGVLEMQQMLTLPALIRNIAVISSPDAAGYGDFCDQLSGNEYHFPYRLTLFPAIVQGDRAAQSVLAALDNICQQKDQFDVVVIIRGGGANTDLSCFDDYLLSAACAQFPLPILTGIGHQRDTSVVDIVAYKALKTPTAVAEFLIDRLSMQINRLDSLQQRFRQVIEHILSEHRHHLDNQQLRLKNHLQNIIYRNNQRLTSYEKVLQLLSPENLYKKGYTLTCVNGKPAVSVAGVHKGDILLTEFIDGKVTSIVETDNDKHKNK